MSACSGVGKDVPQCRDDRLDGGFLVRWRTGFHVTKSEVVDAPIIDELPMTLECKLLSFDEESELLLGEIVNVSADERILDGEGNIDPQKLRPITFDPVHNNYLVLGEKVGNAFEDGKKLK